MKFNKPLLLDLYCGVGGAARGYQTAGFEVVGVDLNYQPHYAGDAFVQADALTTPFDMSVFDAIHASPPCQAFSVLGRANPQRYADLVGPTRDLLRDTGLPYVIENVPGSPLHHSIVLCGSMFGLGSGDRQLRRHRWFESNVAFLTPPCAHEGEAIGVYGGGPVEREGEERGGYQGLAKEKQEAMGIDWVAAAGLNQAIPPAYTEFIGSQLMERLGA